MTLYNGYMTIIKGQMTLYIGVRGQKKGQKIISYGYMIRLQGQVNL